MDKVRNFRAKSGTKAAWETMTPQIAALPPKISIRFFGVHRDCFFNEFGGPPCKRILVAECPKRRMDSCTCNRSTFHVSCLGSVERFRQNHTWLQMAFFSPVKFHRTHRPGRRLKKSVVILAARTISTTNRRSWSPLRTNLCEIVPGCSDVHRHLNQN